MISIIWLHISNCVQLLNRKIIIIIIITIIINKREKKKNPRHSPEISLYSSLFAFNSFLPQLNFLIIDWIAAISLAENPTPRFASTSSSEGDNKYPFSPFMPAPKSTPLLSSSHGDTIADADALTLATEEEEEEEEDDDDDDEDDIPVPVAATMEGSAWRKSHSMVSPLVL